MANTNFRILSEKELMNVVGGTGSFNETTALNETGPLNDNGAGETNTFDIPRGGKLKVRVKVGVRV